MNTQAHALKSLNLPPISENFLTKDNKEWQIYDIVRKKKLLLTPEEWVRQHFVHFLLNAGYPPGLIGIEKQRKYGKLQKRSDILAYDRQGTPFLLVECKAAHIGLNTDTLKQLLIYNQSCKSPFIALTNGVQHHYWHLSPTTHALRPLTRLPTFPD